MVKATWNGIVLEGTPGEIKETIALLQAEGQGTTSKALTESSSGEGITYVSYDVARTALTRRPLHPIQRKLLKAIYDAHPNMISGEKLQKIVGYSRPQFSGLMGALGRRFAYTQGYREGSWVFQQSWNDEEHCYYYSLPQELKSALEDLNIVNGSTKSHAGGK